MATKRTDLAMEARELWQESAGKTTKLSGVKARETENHGFKINTVEILNDEGQRELKKPMGKYVTIDLGTSKKLPPESFQRATEALAEELRLMMKPKQTDSVLVVGLGNTAITPDSVGPRALESTMITRHLAERLPDYFGKMRRVSAISPGVLGTTGLESAEIVRGVAEKAQPDLIIVIDALAARSVKRLCSTIQLASTGIIPGSGVGNSRAAFNRETLGVPVTAIGVPTVVDAATLEADICQQVGSSRESTGDEALIVTPKDIDAGVKELALMIGYGINLALHEDFSFEDVTVFLS